MAEKLPEQRTNFHEPANPLQQARGQSIHRYSRPVFGTWFLVLGSFLLGCGSKDQTVSTEGIVTLDNQPIEGAVVTFIPDDERARAASALSDSDGRFSLTTFSDGDGAIPGGYRVIVRKRDPMPEPQPGEIADQKSGITEFKIMEERRKHKSQLPVIYANEKTTPFHFTVPVEGKVILDLKSQSKK